MMRSLFAGASGLRNHQVRMDVIGDNIANVNTLGFKGSQVQFSTILAQTISGGSAPFGDRGGTNPMQVGLGSTLGAVTSNFQQGSLQSTGIISDLALEGSAMFVLGAGERLLYTRAGAFRFDANGLMTDPVTGYGVRGYMADAEGDIQATGAPGEIRLPIGRISEARATSEMSLGGNLNADSQALGTILHSQNLSDASTGSAATTGTLLVDLTNQAGTSSGLLATDVITIEGRMGGVDITPASLTVTGGNTLGDLASAIESAFGLPASSVTIDGSGAIRVAGPSGLSSEISELRVRASDSGGTVSRGVFDAAMTTIETQAARDAEMYVLSRGVFDSLGFQHELIVTFTRTDTDGLWDWEATMDGQEVMLSGMTGTVRFTAGGTLDSWSYDDASGQVSIDPGNGANTMRIGINAGEPGSLSGLTQYASPSAALAVGQDGRSMGVLDSVAIDQNGMVVGSFSNGVSRTLAQLAVAVFANPSGLQRAEGNNFEASANSGEPIIGTLGARISGRILPGSLEMSNVDLAMEFTNMVIAQRGFQSNARIITTADDMLNELVNLKR